MELLLLPFAAATLASLDSSFLVQPYGKHDLSPRGKSCTFYNARVRYAPMPMLAVSHTSTHVRGRSDPSRSLRGELSARGREGRRSVGQTRARSTVNARCSCPSTGGRKRPKP